jgi:hypothetical protein
LKKMLRTHKINKKSLWNCHVYGWKRSWPLILYNGSMGLQKGLVYWFWLLLDTNRCCNKLVMDSHNVYFHQVAVLRW